MSCKRKVKYSAKVRVLNDLVMQPLFMYKKRKKRHITKMNEEEKEAIF